MEETNVTAETMDEVEQEQPKKKWFQRKKKEKKEKVKKEKKPKKEKPPRKQRKKKQQESDEQDAEDGTEKGGKKAKKPLTKKKIIVLAALLLSIIAVLSFVAAYILSGRKEPEVLTRYEVNGESVAVITTIVGERPEPEIEEVEDKKAKNSELKKMKYTYTGLDSGCDDVKKYVAYLTDECGFVPMITYDINNPAGYISVATKSVNENCIFQIDIDYTDEDYVIYVSSPEGKLPEPKKEKKEEEKAFTRGDAETLLQDYSSEKLGIPQEISDYITIFDVGQTIIDGITCYGINVYQKSAVQSNEYVGKFYVALDKSIVYKYNPEDGSCTPIPN